jgi:hypothetical protein
MGSLWLVHGREPIMGRRLRAVESHWQNLFGEASCRQSRSSATCLENEPRIRHGSEPFARRTNK